MLKTVITVLFALLFLAVDAQYKVKFVLKEKTAIHHDSIYITGTMTNWDSTANPAYLMQHEGPNEKLIVLDVKAGPLRYKFHRGSWFTVEKQYSGDEVPDHTLIITKDTTVTDSVSSWRDELMIDKKYSLTQSIADTTRVFILTHIANNYAFFPETYNSDSALLYAQKALQLQQKISKSAVYTEGGREKDRKMLIDLQELVAGLLHSLGNYPKALEIRLENINLAGNVKDKFVLAEALSSITNDYYAMKDYRSVLYYGKLMDSVMNTLDAKDVRFKNGLWFAKNTIAYIYRDLNLPDSALYYARKLDPIVAGLNAAVYVSLRGMLLGDIYRQKGDIDSAFFYYRRSIPLALSYYGNKHVATMQIGMAKLFQQTGHIDSALYYAKRGFSYFQNNKVDVQAWGENSDYYLADISPLLAELYNANHQADSAYKYLHLSVILKDSLYNSDRIRQFQTLSFNETTRRNQLDQQQKEAQQQYKTRIKIYGLIGGMAAFLVLAFILYRNNKHKQEANVLLQHQKQEIEKTLVELKNTQKQLVQSEKMASLGELTAGIAHEIQNPLNFVNNFSEVNKELVDELQQELKAGKIEEAIAISQDIKDNEDKINHHGKRADAIVKGMLQHSRSGSGQKELTDVNKLADEYLRLAYHGLRAKDKSFNATLKTDYDASIGSINIIPQDIGRVVLNLIMNAFYATGERRKLLAVGYEPLVTVSTRKTGDKVLISVKDNGGGIPQNIVDKIFQPFFTTKPTGQGTGLGLSLAYDIVKAHSGELNVNTKENEGSEFILQLPTV
ncbi:MAG: ATP-binding protein [Bacteroidota bacterium]